MELPKKIPIRQLSCTPNQGGEENTTFLFLNTLLNQLLLEILLILVNSTLFSNLLSFVLSCLGYHTGFARGHRGTGTFCSLRIWVITYFPMASRRLLLHKFKDLISFYGAQFKQKLVIIVVDFCLTLKS